MRRSRRGVGKTDHLDDSITLKALDEHHRNIIDHDHDHDHDDLLDSVSPLSMYRPQPCPNDLPISTKTPSRRRNRKNHRDRRSARKSDQGCSYPAVGSFETEVASLRIGERAEEIETETSERVEEIGCDVSKDENRVFDAMEILEELVGFGVEEPELSDEILRINSQAQEDELLAMESIYGDNVLKLDRHNGLQTFQVHIEIEARNGISVTVKLDSSGNQKTEASSENTDEFSYSFNVQYLPPIVLTCALPKSYPSHRPPYFTISTQWLDPVNTSKLCSMLDSIWNEQMGQEVIYQWVEWLSSYSLSFLGFQTEVMLGPYGTRDTEDKRAVSGIVSPDIDIPLIRRYNDERLHENFQHNLHECCICFSEYPGAEFARLPCHHFFCWKCLKIFSDMHVTEGTTNKLQCPQTKCGSMIPPSLLKRLLSQEEYERWESLTLEKTLESMPDIVYCPRCNMPCIEEEDNHTQCFKCFFSFCTLCRDPRHVGFECMSSEQKLRILQERQNSSQLAEEQRRKELEMMNEIMSVKAILRDAKQCPSCKMAISRIEGCNKMVCNNCGQYFCYRCSKAIDGYDHFREGTCDLFPQETIRQWEERVNPRQVLAQVRAQLGGGEGPGQICPTCRQFNVKIGNNNHLLCWSCQAHFCYLCKQIVRRGTQHYGPKGCKQHTPG